MTPSSSPAGSVRSAAEAAVWNEEIRKFWQRVGGRPPLTAAEQVEYARLLAGWAAARGDVVQAA